MSKSNSNSNNQGRRGSRRRKGGKKAPNPDEFWGATDLIPAPADRARITTDPTAVVRSLGRAPLSGHHNIADHYFAAVYERSVQLAAALATAGELIDSGDLAGDGA